MRGSGRVMGSALRGVNRATSACASPENAADILILARPHGTLSRQGYPMRHRRPHPPATHHPHRSEWKRKVAGRRAPHGGEARASGADAVILYGWHTVKAALENPARRIRRLYATANAARRLAEDGVALAVEPELVRPDAIPQRLGPDPVPHGPVAEADPPPP